MNQPKSLLVTGCYRSGTTVLEKILNMHPRVICASQPFPVLYFFVKELFLEEQELRRRYPLGHLFREDGFQPPAFYAFLDRRILERRDLEAFFDRMEGYTDGLWTPEIMRFRDALRPGTFYQVYRQLGRCIAELFPKPGARYLGSKEVLVEELVPYLLARGVTVLLVVRDPRAMISSLDFRDRDNLTGEHRPVLYSLRAWRKSVAIALASEGRAGFHWLRYEDLVTRNEEALGALTRFLGLAPYSTDAFAGGILDQYGKPWRGNSSFTDRRGISTASVRAFERKLPKEVVEYVETVCYPEMRALGYDFRVAEAFDPAVLAGFREPFATIHSKFSRDYGRDPDRLTEERERIARLERAGPLDAEEARRWFIDEAAYRRLRAAVR